MKVNKLISVTSIFRSGCAACLSKKKVVGKSTAGQTPVTIVDETDDWEFLSMYWWSRCDILYIFKHFI